MKDLSLASILSIGIVATVVGAAAIFLLGIRPTQADIREHERYNGELERKAALIPQAQGLVQLAERKVQEAKEDLARYEVEKMPKTTIDLTKPLQAWVGYHDMIREIGKKLENWPGKTGVAMLTGFQLPPPPTDPNQLPQLLITYPIQGVQVRAGSFQSLLNHVKAWNKVPNLLVLVDGLAIQGTSPGQLYGTYSMTVYVFPKGQPGETVPTVGAGGAAPAGAPGMGMGGFGGPPPGMGGFGGPPPGIGGPPAPGAPGMEAPGGRAK